MTSPAAERRTYERWLCELTALPTAAGREDRVIAWVEDWVAERRSLKLRRDHAGNLFITRTGRRTGKPILLTAHLDHPGFVTRRMLDDRHVEMEFRGGVHDPYFERAKVDVFDREDVAHRGTILELDPAAKPFKRVVVRLDRRTDAIARGDIGRWAFRGALPRISGGLLHTYACDDLAAAAAALATLDRLRSSRTATNVGVLLTRAEEVGFIGTLAVCEAKRVSKATRMICLENSRSFPDSPIGGGPILRVGDKMSVYGPALTNRIAQLLALHEEKNPGFKWQRKLMAGGTCEASAFSVFGWEATCVCLPLGNYHNMSDIDGVLAGRRPAKVGPEYISVDDFHGMIDLLHLCATKLDSARLPSLEARLEGILRRHRHVLDG